ncbi:MULTISPECIES: universal stress protein [Streptomyces]|uniref:universal stress protein n=1 Tax=Streptomyces TaxID=1883 RepID=UPI00140A80E1|nr:MULTISPECIES: universal stress protein [Streptomyces]MDH6228602.1 nucleotide-binding universal stress UspA family protein [Streptomyces sp. MJP52]
MTRPIAVGVDGTPESLAALEWAAVEAGRRGTGLRVAHVWEPRRVSGAEDRSGTSEEQERWVRQGVEDSVRGLAERHPGLDVSTHVRRGEAAEGLLETADGAGMLVLGSRGRGILLGFLLGSVGRQAIAEADLPVVLIRADVKGGSEAAGEVVVGQQGDPEDSAETLRFAFETAAAAGAPLRAVRAWSLPPVFTYSPGSLQLLDEAGGPVPFERKALAAALAPWRERFPGVRVTEHVEMGSAGEVLLSLSGGARLMVVGRRAHRAAIGSRLGSVADAVIHHAASPVAVVPPAPTA